MEDIWKGGKKGDDGEKEETGMDGYGRQKEEKRRDGGENKQNGRDIYGYERQKEEKWKDDGQKEEKGRDGYGRQKEEKGKDGHMGLICLFRVHLVRSLTCVVFTLCYGINWC